MYGISASNYRIFHNLATKIHSILADILNGKNHQHEPNCCVTTSVESTHCTVLVGTCDYVGITFMLAQEAEVLNGWGGLPISVAG